VTSVDGASRLRFARILRHLHVLAGLFTLWQHTVDQVVLFFSKIIDAQSAMQQVVVLKLMAALNRQLQRSDLQSSGQAAIGVEALAQCGYSLSQLGHAQRAALMFARLVCAPVFVFTCFKVQITVFGAV
jgi:hypothetical protein